MVTHKSTPIKVGAAIVRVSTEIQSYDRQIVDINRFAEAKNFLIPDELVFKEKISGRKKMENRQSLDNVLVLAKEGKIAAVFCTELSRISRVPLDLNYFIETLCEYKIPLHILNPELCTLDSNGKKNGMVFIILSILAQFAEFEVEQTRHRIVSHLANSAKQLKRGGAYLPYGFTKEPETGKMIVDDSESKVIKEIFRLCLMGKSSGFIANQLNDKGIPTKSKLVFDKINEQKRKDKLPEKLTIMSKKYGPVKISKIKWRAKTVYDILTNTIHYGKWRYKNEFIDIKGIIDEETFNEAQKQLQFNKNKGNVRNSEYFYLLKDIVKCGVCGKSYYGKFSNKVSNYLCISKRYKGESCGNDSINIKGLEGLIWTILYKETSFIELARFSAAHHEVIQNRLSKLSSSKNALIDKINVQNGKIQRVIQSQLDNELSDEEVKPIIKEQKNLKKQYESELDEIDEKIIECQNALSTTSTEEYNQKSILSLVKSKIKLSELVRKVIQMVTITNIKGTYKYFVNIQYWNGYQHTAVYLREKKYFYLIPNTILKYNTDQLCYNCDFSNKIIIPPIYFQMIEEKNYDLLKLLRNIVGDGKLNNMDNKRLSELDLLLERMSKINIEYLPFSLDYKNHKSYKISK